jgi:hypothetical protein
VWWKPCRLYGGDRPRAKGLVDARKREVSRVVLRGKQILTRNLGGFVYPARRSGSSMRSAGLPLGEDQALRLLERRPGPHGSGDHESRDDDDLTSARTHMSMHRVCVADIGECGPFVRFMGQRVFRCAGSACNYAGRLVPSRSRPAECSRSRCSSDYHHRSEQLTRKRSFLRLHG